MSLIESDRRVRAKEFMDLLSIKKDKFYSLVNTGDIEQPTRLTKKDVFWYASYVKNKVEQYKINTNKVCS